MSELLQKSRMEAKTYLDKVECHAEKANPVVFARFSLSLRDNNLKQTSKGQRSLQTVHLSQGVFLTKSYLHLVLIAMFTGNILGQAVNDYFKTKQNKKQC